MDGYDDYKPKHLGLLVITGCLVYVHLQVSVVTNSVAFKYSLQNYVSCESAIERKNGCVVATRAATTCIYAPTIRNSFDHNAVQWKNKKKLKFNFCYYCIVVPNAAAALVGDIPSCRLLL